MEILAFCESGLESIDLSKTGIKVITQWCFRNCRNLKTVKLPDKLEKIGAQAFFDCISLEVLEIPDAKIKIERSAFGNCNPSLKMLFLQNGYTQDYVDQIFKS